MTPNPPEALATAEFIAYVLADLAIILVAARLVGGLFVRLEQPRVVRETIAGVLIGPTVLGGDLAALADEWAATDAIAGDPADAEALAAAGIRVQDAAVAV